MHAEITYRKLREKNEKQSIAKPKKACNQKFEATPF